MLFRSLPTPSWPRIPSFDRSIGHLADQPTIGASPADWTRVAGKITNTTSPTFVPSGETQFVLLRVFYRGGSTQIALSKAIQIGDDADRLSRQRRTASDVLPPQPYNLYCPIDAANRCRLASENPGARIVRQYGPAEWSVTDPVNLIVK